jgi:ATP citrate (pro-S)-lyase
MSAKAIREFEGKRLLGQYLNQVNTSHSVPVRLGHLIDNGDNQDSAALEVKVALDQIYAENTWLQGGQKLVVKPDQLIKRRGKSGLILLNASWEEVKEWVLAHAGKDVTVDGITGTLDTFIVEEFLVHKADEEAYICIQSVPEGDQILLCAEGGVDVGDVDAKASKLVVRPFEQLSAADVSGLIEGAFRGKLEGQRKAILSAFIAALLEVYKKCHFTYLEVNPLVQLADGSLHMLDLAGKVDQTAEYECFKVWGALEFPSPFGRRLTKEEQYICDLDAKTGASLKLTVLNKDGRIWTMVAGGGASVAYSDAIANLGYAGELANYGEYSGAPSETQTYDYSKTILDLMTRGAVHPAGKLLFIGGGIANFTNVAATFKGIIRAIEEYQYQLVTHRVSVYVRRGGPNYQEGLDLMRELGDRISLPIHVFGPETHITAIVPMALAGQAQGERVLDRGAQRDLLARCFTPKRTPSPGAHEVLSNASSPPSFFQTFSSRANVPKVVAESQIMHNETRAFLYGMQPKAVQGMLDFDYISKRSRPSVAGMIYPFGGDHVQRFYWGAKETLINVYADVAKACATHPNVDFVINFSSCRSVWESCREIMDRCPQIRVIAVIAEGVPERYAKMLATMARERAVTIIGAATVGGLRAGAFKIGNTGGMIDNIISSKLYRPGSVSYISKSGGMSNELNNILARATDGVLEGIAIGGDRYPCTGFLDHLLRYEKDPACRMIVLLGEVGGQQEYDVVEAVKAGRLTKPIVAWCLGVCADMFTSEVQFGHAGAFANDKRETARAKNAAMQAVGILVPDSFEGLPALVEQTYNDLVRQGVIVPGPEPEVPKMPIDYAWAQELGLIRKPAQFVSTICDDRGQELLYAGMPISSVFRDEIGIGGVISLLWFKRRLPDWACKFIEMILMLTADHGPAVSGAHNTIVTSRAGRDLVSSITTGLLTIGERFGGALDGAAQQFTAAYDQNWSPQEFVNNTRKEHRLIMGIGHKIKSRTNPDLRVSILKDYATRAFPETPLLNYALEVEKITTQKKDSLILNVDGAIAVLFVDLLRHSGAFTHEESEEYIRIGALNGLFVLGRSIGFIGHYLDQKRLKQGLYRHPWDDISYMSADAFM